MIIKVQQITVEKEDWGLCEVDSLGVWKAASMLKIASYQREDK